MGEAFIVRRGGGTLFAAIGVTYPVGSICTCSNGTITLTAGNTSGTWIFSIPSTGTWTVAITDGTETASKNVSITAQGQCKNVDISYFDGTIYDTGVIAAGLTTQITATNGTVTLATDKIEFTQNANANAQPRITFYPINLTDWNTLKANFHGASGAGKNIYPAVFVADTVDASVWASTYAKENLGPSTDATISLDVSAIAGTHYVGVASTTNSGTWAGARSGQYCNKVWLE